eukprot:scaffold9848_cov90-Isochrysis_galbana.AAC.4
MRQRGQQRPAGRTLSGVTSALLPRPEDISYIRVEGSQLDLAAATSRSHSTSQHLAPSTYLLGWATDCRVHR